MQYGLEYLLFYPVVIHKWCLHAATVGRWWRDFKLPQEIFDLAATTILCSAMAHWEISTHFFSLSYWKPRNDEIYCFKRWFLLFQVMTFSVFILIFKIKSDTDFFLWSDYNLCLMAWDGYDYFLLLLPCKSSIWFTKKHLFKITIYCFNTLKCAENYII